MENNKHIQTFKQHNIALNESTNDEVSYELLDGLPTNEVTVIMRDELAEGLPTVERTIDITNLMVNDVNAPSGWERDILGTEKQQREKINQWISERGNEQHETLLSLVSWEIN